MSVSGAYDQVLKLIDKRMLVYSQQKETRLAFAELAKVVQQLKDEADAW